MRREALIERRAHCGFTQETLAQAMEVAVGTVSQWERGVREPGAGRRLRLADLLNVSLIELDRLLGNESPIELNGHRVPRWLTTYESLVLEAGAVAKIERASLPGMFQTRTYAARIERYGPIELTDGQVVERVDQRIARQSVLDRQPEPLMFTALISEQLIRDAVGSTDTMVEQLDHLLVLGQRPNISIRLLPSDGRAACAQGGFELLTKPDESEPFMVVSFSVGRVHYDDDPLIVDRFVNTYNYVESVALSADESAARIQAIKESHHR